MIYICQGCKCCTEGSCKGCAKGCDCCGDACSGCNRCVENICSGLVEGLSKLCTPCGTILHRPLGGYVVLSSFLCLPALICSVIALLEYGKNKQEQGFLAMVVNAVLAGVHIFMALYLQTRIHYGLQAMARQPLPLTGAPPGAGDSTAMHMMKEAGHIALYDILFCLYIFVFAFSFVWQFIALTRCIQIGGSSPLPYIGVALMLIFHSMAGCFSMCWTATMACADCCSRGPFASCMECLFGKEAVRPQGPTIVQGAPQPGVQMMHGQPQQHVMAAQAWQQPAAAPPAAVPVAQAWQQPAAAPPAAVPVAQARLSVAAAPAAAPAARMSVAAAPAAAAPPLPPPADTGAAGSAGMAEPSAPAAPSAPAPAAAAAPKNQLQGEVDKAMAALPAKDDLLKQAEKTKEQMMKGFGDVKNLFGKK